MNAERRKDVRKRTFLKGQIIFNNGAATMDCLVRDLSAHGARLELSETTTLPEVFDLHIRQKETTYRSILRWRRNDGVGVTFDDPARTAATGQDASLALLLRRIAELEAENASLRALLAKADA